MNDQPDDAFARWYRRDEGYVYRYALGKLRGRPSDADDITNETFFKAFHRYKLEITQWPESQARKALRTTAHNLIVDLWRAEKKVAGGVVDITDHIEILGATSSEPEDPANEDAQSDIADTRTGEERIAAFLAALLDAKKLTDREYHVAFMTWVDGQSVAQIAEALNTTRRAVYIARYRAKRKMRELAETRNLELVFPDEENAEGPDEPDDAGELGEGDATA